MPNPDNLLLKETSPYLLQHADNPVNWHPWNQQALDKAIHEDKPILLSIGYSACHWCHVMAHESFEDTDTAKIMNEHFVNIKVDREERPDLDKIYQTAHSLLTSKPGGWPLTVFLSPHNQMPFYAGTYFPDQRRYNMPSFSEILLFVSDAYNNKKTEIAEQDSSIQKVLDNISQHEPSQTQLNSLPLDLARKQLEGAFNKQFGGFSGAPKFPHADMVERCLRHYLFLKAIQKTDTVSFDMAVSTLDKMALGGFQDQLGGGFFRYSTDEQWMIPHFEKMLYDNAQLFSLYAQAYAVTSSSLYKHSISSAANWLMREMQSPDGGYYSALDADTDKTEGKTYVWQTQEIQNLISSEEYNVFEKKFNFSEPENFEGSWHLHSTIDNSSLAKSLNLKESQVDQLLYSASEKLLRQRAIRSQPGRDDKILCAWNGLMIRGMSLIGKHLQNEEYVTSADKAAKFIHTHLWKNKRLLASYKDGKSQFNAYLDDYAYLLQGILELIQTSWNPVYFKWAIDIADSMLELFEDKQQGGFYFTSYDHEKLLYRSKSFADDAMPSGNGIAATTLQQLGYLTGNSAYLNAAERTIRCAYNDLSEQAITHCSLLHALELYLTTCTVIVLRGTDENLSIWQKQINKRFIPKLTCIAIENNASIPGVLADKKPMGDICAYICEGTHCLPVITEVDEFLNYLNGVTFHEVH